MPVYRFISPLAIRTYLLDRVEPGPGDCWLWTLRLDPRGYGIAWINGRAERAARASYKAFGGVIPEGYDIHHTCQHRHCINPEHLEPMPHGRHQRLHAAAGAWWGERNSMAKLRTIDVQFIRAARPFLSAPTLAQEFGIGIRNVYHIQSGEGWNHVGPPDFSAYPVAEAPLIALNTLQGVQQDRRERGQPQPPFIEESIILGRTCAGAWE